MTHACCSECRLRFSPVASASLTSCPQCGASLTAIPGLAGAVGFRLYTAGELLDAPLPEAVAAAMPIPDPQRRRP